MKHKAQVYYGPIIFLIILIGLIVTSYLVRRNQENRSKAKSTTVLSFSASTTSPTKSDEFTLDLLIDTGSDNSALVAEIYLSFDPAKVRVVDINQSDFFSNSDSNNIKANYDNERGKIEYFANIAPNPKGTNEGINGQGSLAQITFKALAKGETQISVDSARSIIGAYEEDNNALANALPITINIKDTPSSTPPPRDDVTLSFNPDSSELSPDTNHSVEVVLNTGKNYITAIDLGIKLEGDVPSNILFNPVSIPGLSSILTPPTKNNNTLSYSVGTDFSNNNGYSTNSKSVVIGKITFTSPSSGSLTLEIHPQSKVLGAGGDATTNILSGLSKDTYTFGPVVTPSPSPSITPNSTPCPTLADFNGDNRQCDSRIDGLDYTEIFDNWERNDRDNNPLNDIKNKRPDIDGDGYVQSVEYQALFDNWDCGVSPDKKCKTLKEWCELSKACQN